MDKGLRVVLSTAAATGVLAGAGELTGDSAAVFEDTYCFLVVSFGRKKTIFEEVKRLTFGKISFFVG